MTRSGQILIIDDDRAFLEVYQELLGTLGLLVTVAHSGEQAIEILQRTGPMIDVVLLDQKLQGPGGSDSGLDLVRKVQKLAPFAKTLVVTGYAAPDAIERAFELGVYDYLTKNGAFDALLRAKVRNAVEITTERRLATLSHDAKVRELRDVWSASQSEPDRNRKGALLERLVTLLFHTTPGFDRVDTRLRNEVEEIDIVVENRSDDPMWKHDGSLFLLGECKNWSSKCGVPEYRNFLDKLKTKFGRARTGFFFAVGGFTEPLHDLSARHSAVDALVVPVDAADLDRWITADDRVAVLNELYKRAVFDQNR